MAEQEENSEAAASSGSGPPQSILPGLRRHSRNEQPASTLQSEQARLLYSNLPASIAISAILALILVGFQSLVIDPEG